jgi:CheY-like chemotaxis protein/two-component sensor histidine kinase
MTSSTARSPADSGTPQPGASLVDRRKDDFLGLLAHELRNPLAPIRNAVHVLNQCQDDPQRCAWAREVIERQVDQLAHLLDDLLDLTRLARGKLEARRERIDLRESLARAAEASLPLLERSGQCLEHESPAEPVLVEGDESRLEQVFSNLLNNAAKYGLRGGTVRLSVEHDGGQAVVRVRDQGMGIEKDLLPRLFRLYSQAGEARERDGGGLGIGLALVRGLVELHGGKVEASSDGPGRGSEFVVRLPLLADEVLPAMHGSPDAARQAPMRILVADDNEDAAQTLAVLLEVMGHQVKVAGDGEEAVALARQFSPAVALLDIGMPRLDGYGAAERLRQFLPGTMLIATTGWCRKDDLRRAAAAGFDHHLVKPADLRQVTRLLALAQRPAGAGAGLAA